MSNEKPVVRSYPFTAWVLGGTFIPKQITLTQKSWMRGFYSTQGGKDYSEEDLFETKDHAIKYGESRLKDQEETILKQQAGIAKKRANLEKSK